MIQTFALFLEILRQRMDIIFPSSEIQGFSDQKDNYLLSIAVDGAASFILTGDKKMLEAKLVAEINIVSLAEFERSTLS